MPTNFGSMAYYAYRFVKWVFKKKKGREYEQE